MGAVGTVTPLIPRRWRDRIGVRTDPGPARVRILGVPGDWVRGTEDHLTRVLVGAGHTTGTVTVTIDDPAVAARCGPRALAAVILAATGDQNPGRP